MNLVKKKLKKNNFFNKKMAGIMNVNTSKMEIVKNCGVNCCNSKHYIKFVDEIAIIPTWQIFEIERCWKKNATEKCNVVCPKNNPCIIHSLLNVFTFFSEYIRTTNTETNDIVSKILIEKNCEYKYCIKRWCFEIYERKELTEPATRAKYL